MMKRFASLSSSISVIRRETRSFPSIPLLNRAGMLVHRRQFATGFGHYDEHADLDNERTARGAEQEFVNREERALFKKFLTKLGANPASVDSIRALDTILSRRGIPLSIELKDELVAWKAGLLNAAIYSSPTSSPTTNPTSNASA